MLHFLFFLDVAPSIEKNFSVQCVYIQVVSTILLHTLVNGKFDHLSVFFLVRLLKYPIITYRTEIKNLYNVSLYVLTKREPKIIFY